MDRKHDTSVCDFCSSSFSCTRLDAAMNVLDAHPERLEASSRLAEIYRSVKGQLARAGWDYPNAGKRCALAGSTLEIRRLTDELIAAMERTRGPASLHGEEMHRD